MNSSRRKRFCVAALSTLIFSTSAQASLLSLGIEFKQTQKALVTLDASGGMTYKEDSVQHAPFTLSIDLPFTNPHYTELSQYYSGAGFHEGAKIQATPYSAEALLATPLADIPYIFDAYSKHDLTTFGSGYSAVNVWTNRYTPPIPLDDGTFVQWIHSLSVMFYDPTYTGSPEWPSLLVGDDLYTYLTTPFGLGPQNSNRYIAIGESISQHFMELIPGENRFGALGSTQTLFTSYGQVVEHRLIEGPTSGSPIPEPSTAILVFAALMALIHYTSKSPARNARRG